MKKTLIALLLVGSSSGLFAQNTQNTTNSANPNTNANSSTTTDVNTSPTTTTTDPATNTNTNTSTNVNANTNTNTNVNTDATTNPNTNMSSNSNINTSTDNSNLNNSSKMSSSANMSSTNSVSSSTYNAYGTVAADVPTTVRYSFQKEHPNVTGAQWYQTPNGQLRVMYKDANNQDMDVYYYGTSAQSYMVSLPLRQSLTSDDIVAKAKSMFGLGVYDITRVKAANMEDVYHIRLLDNGQVKSVWISEQGTEVAAADVFRTADVAENDIINEVNTTAPTSDANSTNNNTNTSTNNTTNSANNTNSSNTNNSNSTSPMNSTSTDAGNTNTNASGNSGNTTNSASGNTTTPSSTTTETK